MKKEIMEAINKYNKAPGIDSFESELFKEDTKKATDLSYMSYLQKYRS